MNAEKRMRCCQDAPQVGCILAARAGSHHRLGRRTWGIRTPSDDHHPSTVAMKPCHEAGFHHRGSRSTGRGAAAAGHCGNDARSPSRRGTAWWRPACGPPRWTWVPAMSSITTWTGWFGQVRLRQPDVTDEANDNAASRLPPGYWPWTACAVAAEGPHVHRGADGTGATPVLRTGDLAKGSTQYCVDRLGGTYVP